MIDQSESNQQSLIPVGTISRAGQQAWTTHAAAIGILDDGWATNKPRLKYANNIELSPWVTYTGWYQEIHGQKNPHGNGTRITVQPPINSPSSNWDPLFAKVRKTLARILTDTTEEGTFQNGELISWEKNMKWVRKMTWVFGELGLLREGDILYENGISCSVRNGFMTQRINPQTHSEESGIFQVGIEYSGARLINGTRIIIENGLTRAEKIRDGEWEADKYTEFFRWFRGIWWSDEIYPNVAKILDADARRLFISRYDTRMEELQRVFQIGRKEETIQLLEDLRRYLNSIVLPWWESLLQHL